MGSRSMNQPRPSNVVRFPQGNFEPGLPVPSPEAFDETNEVYLWVASKNDWVVAPESGDEAIPIEQYRPGSKAWTQGPYRCLACRLQWRGVAPVGMPPECQCPRCGLRKAVAVALFQDCDKPTFKCSCGGYYFQLREKGVLCIRCANSYSTEEVWT